MISTSDITSAGLWVATWEGPYHVTPGDRGGPTAFGIALAYHKDFTEAQLQAITVNEAATYLAAHYMPAHAELLPYAIATPLLAFAVLEPAAAVKCLEAAVGDAQDGVIGPETARLAASLPTTGPDGLLVRYFRACMAHLSTRPDFATNAVGWATRQMAASQAVLT